MAEVGKNTIDITSKKSEALADYKAVTFTLAGKDYGVDIMSVREISRGGRFTYVPNTPHFVRGVYNLRGEIIPVVDLRDFFGLPVNREERVEGILICRVKNTTLGLVVDSIEKVIGINKQYIQPAHPMFAEINIQYIEGIIDREDRLYVLLNIHQIFGIAKELIDEEEQAAAEQKHASEPASAPVASDANPAPSVVAQPVSSPAPLAVEPELFIAPVHEQSIPSAKESDEHASALLAMLNAMPEPDTDILAQPDIESLLSESKPHIHEVIFHGQNHEYESLVNSLREHGDFEVNELNRAWINNRANQYLEQGKSLSIEDSRDVERFLTGFFSKSTREIWPQSMLEELSSNLNPREKGIFHVWNPGCAEGYESYSLLGMLLTHGITTTPKIYAQDIDLIAVSSAPHLTFNASELPENFDLLTVQSSVGLQFKNEYKNFIIFEFADIKNRNTFPGIDLIVARDTLSYLTDNDIEKFVEEISEVAEVGTLLVIGDNEQLINDLWRPINSQYLSLYKKIK